MCKMHFPHIYILVLLNSTTIVFFNEKYNPPCEVCNCHL